MIYHFTKMKKGIFYLRNLPSYALIGILNGVARLSWDTMYRISDALRWLVFDILKYRQKVIYGNIQRSFPDKSPKEHEAIAREFHRNFMDIVVEALKMKTISREELSERFTHDDTILRQYHQQGRHLVVVLGHLGNWELGNLYASTHFAHNIVAVYHPLGHPVFEPYFLRIRTKFGTEMIPMREAYKRDPIPGEKPFMYFLINDQSPSPEKAYWTTFLHQPTGMFRGVEVISRKMDCPVIYAAILRDPEKRGRYHIKFQLMTEHPNDLPNNGILEKQAKLLEEDIRLQPANWLWSHKRWKHGQPKVLQPEQLLGTMP